MTSGENAMGEAIRQMFATIARPYDRINSVLSLGLHHHWRQQAVVYSGMQPGAIVLDICSGTADLALAFSRRFGGDGRVVATDFCHPMLTFGIRKAEQQHQRLQFALADALMLPFREMTFDCVSVAFGLRNVDSLEMALREMYRLLRPGGVALVLEFGQPQGRCLGPLYRVYSRYVLPPIGGWLSGSRDAYAYLPRTAAVFPAGARFCQAMTQQDFCDVQARALSGGIVYLYRARRPA